MRDWHGWCPGGDPRTAKAALLHAVAVNPWDTRSRIELGLLAEAEGDSTTSERYLLQAAETDHLFLPRWTLANYYFRRGDTSQFWGWAKEAADRVYGDAQPLFRLCGRVAEDGKLIDRLQIQSADARAGYLSYLLGQEPRRFDRPGSTPLVAGEPGCGWPAALAGLRATAGGAACGRGHGNLEPAGGCGKSPVAHARGGGAATR